jgi:hypothetical protein
MLVVLRCIECNLVVQSEENPILEEAREEVHTLFDFGIQDGVCKNR